MKTKCKSCPYNNNEYCTLEESYIDDIKIPLCVYYEDNEDLEENTDDENYNEEIE